MREQLIGAGGQQRLVSRRRHRVVGITSPTPREPRGRLSCRLPPPPSACHRSRAAQTHSRWRTYRLVQPASLRRSRGAPSGCRWSLRVVCPSTRGIDGPTFAAEANPSRGEAARVPLKLACHPPGARRVQQALRAAHVPQSLACHRQGSLWLWRTLRLWHPSTRHCRPPSGALSRPETGGVPQAVPYGNHSTKRGWRTCDAALLPRHTDRTSVPRRRRPTRTRSTEV